MGFDPMPLLDDDTAEVILVARGIASAVAPASGLSDLQTNLLEAIASGLTGVPVNYRALEPLGAAELADVLRERDLTYRQRIVHHMVLGELVLRPIPTEVAHRVAKYAEALGVKDDFVRVARRYAQGAYGLAWKDLERSGFVEHVQQAANGEPDNRTAMGRDRAAPFAPAEIDHELAARWIAFGDLPEGSLGRSVREMYDGRGFALPGTPGGAPAYLARHDFVHVIADYGTNLKGELEVFAFIGRADPDPKGFAWLVTLTGLFETGYIPTTGFFDRDVRERVIQAPGMHQRIADAMRRGKLVCENYGVDLFDVDYYDLATRPVAEVREMLGIPPKGHAALEAGSAGLFEFAGMSETQQRAIAQRPAANTSEDPGPNLSATRRRLPCMAIARFPSFVLDCDNPGRLAEFYGTLLDWKATSDEGWGEVRNAAGDQCICFQRVEQFRPPNWPGQDIPQQMHMDVMVDDLDAGEQAVLELGATRAEHQPGTTFRVFLDPAGHPFCLCVS